MLEEMRWMEYAQRLSREERGVCVDQEGIMANFLLDAATINGARTLGLQGGKIHVGKLADFTVINLNHIQLKGVLPEYLPAAICCGCDNAIIDRTIINGV